MTAKVLDPSAFAVCYLAPNPVVPYEGCDLQTPVEVVLSPFGYGMPAACRRGESISR